MNNPKISIITPSYNQGQFIEETIKSVVNQDYPNIEYIIIDGGSTDNSVNIIKKYAEKYKFIKWISEKDNGQSDGINKGFKMSRGDILAWINSDDTYTPNAFKNVAEFFLKHPSVDAIVGECNEIDERGNIIRKMETREVNYDKMLNVYHCEYFPQLAVFFRRRIFEKTGYINTNYQYAFDFDFWMRIAQKYNIKKMDKLLANFRVHEKSKTVSEEEKFVPEIYNIVKKHKARFFSPLRSRLRRYFIKKRIKEIINFPKSRKNEDTPNK